MLSHVRVGAAAIAILFALASAVPADAQHRQRSGSSAGSGAKAAPRSAQGGGGQSAAARPAQGPGQSAGPRPSQGSGQSARPRQPQGQGGGSGPHAAPRPGPRPGSAGGYRGYYPGGGYRGYYPGYGYRGYRGYYPGFSFGLGAFYGPYYYSPWFYGSWGYYAPYYGYGYGYDYGYAYGPGGASLKVEVKPTNAEVYVDGHLAGIVDQFDGMFQSLSVEPGGHDITVYLDGFRSIRQQLYLSAGSTYRIKGALEPLAPGEQSEPRPQAAVTQYDSQLQMEPQYRRPQPQYRVPAPQGPPPDRDAPEAYIPAPGDSKFGQVAIRVQPADAAVLIDGEPWNSPANADRLVVHLAPGTHRIEIRKDGFDPFVTAFEIRRGETTALNVSLARF